MASVRIQDMANQEQSDDQHMTDHNVIDLLYYEQ